jgi:RNA polymerase sigma-70 factor (ECF subfamily)
MGEVLVRMTGSDNLANRNYTLADDAQLVEWAKDDSLAFGELYERYVKKIYNYVYYRTGNHDDAEDLTSRVFFRALGHIGSYTDRGVPFSAWLYRIAHNLIANWHRDRGRQRVLPLDDYLTSDGHLDGPEAATESLEERDRLLISIRELPAERQELLVLKFVERMSNAEIGKIMDRTEGAIKSLYHRTLLSLRSTLEDDDVSDVKSGGRRLFGL